MKKTKRKKNTVKLLERKWKKNGGQIIGRARATSDRFISPIDLQ